MPVRKRLRRLCLDCVIAGVFVGACFAKPVLPHVVFGEAKQRVTTESAAEGDTPPGEPQFDTTPTPLPPNVPSVRYHTTSTSELGDLVRLEGAAHFIDSVTVTMSSWAIRSDYAGSAPFGFTHPITLKLYDVDRSTGRVRPGAVLATVTTPFLIPWRPEPDSAAPNSPLRPWRAADGNFYGGLAFNITFDLSAHDIVLPDDVIFSISFNTQRHGDKPMGVDGPHNALSVGVTGQPPSPGSDIAPGAVYWKTADGTFYADEGAAGVNVFRLDTGWGVYTPAVRFNNSPYGTLAALTTRLMDMQSEQPRIMRALIEARAFATSALERSLWENNRELRLAWGGTVFGLIAETANELSTIAASRDRLAPEAQRAVDSLAGVAQSLAEAALGDAILASGSALGIVRAQDAFDAAAEARAGGQAALVIDELGNAWREAQAAVK